MDQIEINNPFAKEIPDELIREVLEDAIRGLRKDNKIPKKKAIQISVALVSDKDIAKLNKKYRQEDNSTDVLSFSHLHHQSRYPGEIILSPKIIRKYAEEDGEKFEKELKKNIVHGLLHIIGQEHGEKMSGLQKTLLKDIK